MKNAKATTKGWINPKTGELLKAQKMTQEKADQLNGVVAEAPKPVEVKPEIIEESPAEEPVEAPKVVASIQQRFRSRVNRK